MRLPPLSLTGISANCTDCSSALLQQAPAEANSVSLSARREKRHAMQLRQRKGSQSKTAAGVGGARRGTALKALKFTGPDKAQHDDAMESVVVEAFGHLLPA